MRDDRGAALVDGCEAFIERQALGEDLLGVVDLAAARAGEVAAEERLEHQDERVALDAAEALLEEVLADAVLLDEGDAHGMRWGSLPGARQLPSRPFARNHSIASGIACSVRAGA